MALDGWPRWRGRAQDCRLIAVRCTPASCNDARPCAGLFFACRLARPRERVEHIARRKQIWQALHPAGAVPEWEKGEDEANSGTSDSTIPHRGPGRPKDFAASTAELTGQSKQHINRQVAIAEALGDDLQKVEGTSLDKGAPN